MFIFLQRMWELDDTNRASPASPSRYRQTRGQADRQADRQTLVGLLPESCELSKPSTHNKLLANKTLPAQYELSQSILPTQDHVS